METTIQRLKEIEEQSKLWQKHCEEEEQRIEDEYASGIAEIERAYKEATRKIQLEFQARREASIKQHCGKDVLPHTASHDEDHPQPSQLCLPDVPVGPSDIDTTQMKGDLNRKKYM